MSASPFFQKTALVTGAGGFIGSHLVKALADLDCRTFALIFQNSKNFRKQKNIFSISGDVTEFEKINKIVKKIRPDFVFHLAGLTAHSPEMIKGLLEVNLGGTLNVLNSLLGNSSLRRMVFMGTCEEYGRNRAPFNESQRPKPLSSYAFSKAMASLSCIFYAETFNLPVVVLRPTVIYGPGQRNKMFIPSLVKALLLHQPFKMTKGEQKRDFIYIEDAIDAILKSAAAPNLIGEIINIGSGRAESIKKTAVLAKKLVNSPSRISCELPYPSFEIMNYSCDISKAEKLLGWKPYYSLKAGLKKFIK